MQSPWAGQLQNPWTPAAPRSGWPTWAIVTAAVAAALLVFAVTGWGLTQASRSSATSRAAVVQPVAPGGGGAPAGLETAPRTPDGTVVDVAMAKRVVRAYWSMHEQAFASTNMVQLSRLSSGPGREWEQAAVSCGCWRIDAPRPFIDATYLVPRQKHYPASFIAQVLSRYHGLDEYHTLVFTKPRPRASWSVSEMNVYETAAGSSRSLFEPAVDAAGYDRPVGAGQHRRALTIAAHAAEMWQQAKETASVPTESEFMLTRGVVSRLQEIAAHKQDGLQVNGLYGHYRFFVSPRDSLAEVALTGGYELACQPVREEVHYHPAAGHLIVQDPAQRNWGPPLPAGTYHELTSRDVWQTCFEIPPDDAGQVVLFNQNVGGAVATGRK